MGVPKPLADLAGELHELLDGWSQVDVGELPDPAIHEQVIGLVQARARLEGALHELLGLWDARGVWSGDGSRTPAARLRAETGVAKSDASRLLRRGAWSRDLSVAAAAVRDGRLQPACLDALHDAAKVELDVPFSHVEEMLVTACAEIGVDQAARVLRNWARTHDRAGDEARARRRHEERHLTATATFEGVVHLQGMLPAVGGHELIVELDRIELDLCRADQESGSLRTATQRRADALVIMARRSATLDVDEHAAGRGPRVLLTLALGTNAAERLCETLSGTPLAVGDIVPELDRCDIERIWFDGDDQPIYTSQQRSFTGALRRAIRLRDGGCTHPAICDEPAERCDVDHVTPWAAGGGTSIDNGRLLCRRHNRNVDLRARLPRGWRIIHIPRGWIPTRTRPRPAAHRTSNTGGGTTDDDP